MPNYAKPSQTTHNYYVLGTYRIILNQISKKPQKNVSGRRRKKEDESSIKSRLNKQQAVEATKKPRVANTRIHFQQILTQFRI